MVKEYAEATFFYIDFKLSNDVYECTIGYEAYDTYTECSWSSSSIDIPNLSIALWPS